MAPRRADPKLNSSPPPPDGNPLRIDHPGARGWAGTAPLESTELRCGGSFHLVVVRVFWVPSFIGHSRHLNRDSPPQNAWRRGGIRRYQVCFEAVRKWFSYGTAMPPSST